jgi:hypothetical protein
VTLNVETLAKIGPTDPLLIIKVSQTGSAQEAKLIRFLVILRPKRYPHDEHARKSNAKSHHISVFTVTVMIRVKPGGNGVFSSWSHFSNRHQHPDEVPEGRS